MLRYTLKDNVAFSAGLKNGQVVPTTGHFRIAEAEWLVDGKKRILATGVSTILIPVDQVEMVEFLSETHEEPEE